jgi:ubiquinone/menaquinone biosynthesis C-methylase UbiE
MNQMYAINRNIEGYRKISDSYDAIHGEIFNEIEQERLNTMLRCAVSYLEIGADRYIAIDYGCGTGNVINHLLSMNVDVIAVDIAKNLLDIVSAKYKDRKNLHYILSNGYDLSCIKDESIDIITVYSVLHHIPDYMRIIGEFCRIVKPGGIIYIDHEHSPDYWNQTKEYKEFIQSMKSRSLKKYLVLLKPHWYYIRFRLFINPRYQPEGDIHVFPDDHIEWNDIEKMMSNHGFGIILKEDYLNYKSHYKFENYQKYSKYCNDMRLMIIKKN